MEFHCLYCGHGESCHVVKWLQVRCLGGETCNCESFQSDVKKA
jgi:hypothetical protein